MRSTDGALAQLGERLICIQEVRSSILLGSTIILGLEKTSSIRSISTAQCLSVQSDDIVSPTGLTDIV